MRQKKCYVADLDVTQEEAADLSLFEFGTMLIDQHSRFLQYRITCKECGKGWNGPLFDKFHLGQPTKIITQVEGSGLSDLVQNKEHPVSTGLFYKFRGDQLIKSNDNPFLSFFFQFGLKQEGEFKRTSKTIKCLGLSLHKDEAIIVKNGNIAMFSGLNYERK